jgi:hypothetical protein
MRTISISSEEVSPAALAGTELTDTGLVNAVDMEISP